MAGYNLYEAPMDAQSRAGLSQILDAPMREGTDWRAIGRSMAQTAPRAPAAESLVDRGLARAAMYGGRALSAAAPYAEGALSAGSRLMSLPVQAAMIGGGLAGNAIYNRMSPNVADAIGGTINQGMQRLGMGVDDSAYLAQKAAAPSAPAPMDPNASYMAALRGDMQRRQQSFNQRWGGAVAPSFAAN